jgi:16S rRNA (cytosine1402-N4)-methyltransferase
MPGEEQGHVPVLLDEVITYLNPVSKGIYIDGTFGAGGYTDAVLQVVGTKVIAIDRDPDAIKRAESFARKYGDRFTIAESCFSDMLFVAGQNEVNAVDGIMLDVGVSSYQIDQPERGFSYRFDGPLDMRMSGKGESAADVIATKDAVELARIFYQYGEEKRSRRVAEEIVKERQERPIVTTQHLVEVVSRIVKMKSGEGHPAMRVFQALRIYVNNELEELEKALEAAITLLKPGGTLCVVSFHSLEDRMVKRFFQKCGGQNQKKVGLTAIPVEDKPSDFKMSFKKAITASKEECIANPRARSARLRVLERVSA